MGRKFGTFGGEEKCLWSCCGNQRERDKLEKLGLDVTISKRILRKRYEDIWSTLMNAIFCNFLSSCQDYKTSAECSQLSGYLRKLAGPQFHTFSGKFFTFWLQLNVLKAKQKISAF
jgi:hypothetical protein